MYTYDMCSTTLCEIWKYILYTDFTLSYANTLTTTTLGWSSFAKKNFSLRSETKQNEIRFACFSFAHAKNIYFFRFILLFFASNFSLPTKAKSIYVFSLCFTSKNFVFRWWFFAFRFEAKRNQHFLASFHFTRYRLEIWKTDLNIFFVSLQIVPEFHFFLFRFVVFTSFPVFFASFHFQTLFLHRSEKNFASVSLCSVLKWKWRQFRLFFVSFSLCFILVTLLISTFCIYAKQAKKHFFSHWSENNFASVSLNRAAKRKLRHTLHRHLRSKYIYKHCTLACVNTITITAHPYTYVITVKPRT